MSCAASECDEICDVISVDRKVIFSNILHRRKDSGESIFSEKPQTRAWDDEQRQTQQCFPVLRHIATYTLDGLQICCFWVSRFHQMQVVTFTLKILSSSRFWCRCNLEQTVFNKRKTISGSRFFYQFYRVGVDFNCMVFKISDDVPLRSKSILHWKIKN